MAERMAFILDGDDNLSPVFRRIGESAERFHRRLNDAVDESGGELRAFTRAAGGGLQELGRDLGDAGHAATEMGDGARHAAPAVRELGDAAHHANVQVEQFTRDSAGRVRDLRGRFVTAAQSADLLAREAAGTAVEVREVGDASEHSSVRVRHLGDGADRARPSLTRLGSSAGAAGAELGSSGGGLGGAMGAVAGIAALSLLPALGALVPMIAGLGIAAITMKLGFDGVGEAVEAAGKGKKEYAAALKGLTPEARAFTKELVATKKEFSGLGDEVQKAMLPGFTQALKESGPLLKIVGNAATIMGKGFGDAAAGVGRLLKDSGFQQDLFHVLQLGDRFVRELSSGLGGLTTGFFRFGAASEPTLKSLSGGLRSLLGEGLPSMFQGLQTGVDGSSRFLSGLFTMLTTTLGALGKFAGEVARTFGPSLGEGFILTGNLLKLALEGLGAAVRFAYPFFHDLEYGIKSVWLLLEPFAVAAKSAGRAMLDAFLPAGSSVENIRGPLQRLHESIERNKLGIMEYARMFGSALMAMAEGALRTLPYIVSAFNGFATMAVDSVGMVVDAATASFGWIPGLGDKLRNASAEFNTFRNNFVGGLNAAEEKTRSFTQEVAPRLAENRLKMNISSWEQQIAVAKGELSSVPASKRSQLLAHISDLEAKAAKARAELASIHSKTVTVTVVSRNLIDSSLNRSRIVNGVLTRAGGGIVRGPGTSTSDSVPAWLSDGEYVLKASAVSRLGQPFLDTLNAGRMPTPVGAPAAAGVLPAARSGVVFAPQITVQGALDPLAVARQIRELMLKLQRDFGLPTGVIMQ
ncbi:hypothetical protein [Streptomyces sp. NPDC001194]|uniref:hypothetical protein n=1 Tax=Streptomyces sp. NPDC001194 TaxID=3364547 RepID=UPI0036B4A50C